MIREANESDLNRINEIGTSFKNNFSSTYNVKDYIKNDNYIILINEDSIVNAFMIIYNNLDCYELELIVVDENYRRHGIANALLKFFVENYRVINKPVLLEVAKNNKPALNLYRKNNFEVISERKKYYGNIDAYVMKLGD